MGRRSILAPNLPPFVLKTSAVFVPSEAAEPFRLVTHTQKTKKTFASTWFYQWSIWFLTWHVLLVVMPTAHTDTDTANLYSSPGGPPRARCQCDTRLQPHSLRPFLNTLFSLTLYKATPPAQICCRSLQTEIRESRLRRTGSSRWASKEKSWSTFSATAPNKFSSG